MKRWAAVTILLYLLVLVVLTLPVMFVAFAEWPTTKEGVISFEEMLKVYREWGYWLVIGVFVLAQACLLLVPVDTSQRRLPPRRKLLVPVLATAFMLANLALAGVQAVACAIWNDDALEHFGFAGPWLVIGVLLVLWSVWAGIFYHYYKTEEPEALHRRLLRQLMKGSIVELLVAVPSHIIVRHRDGCCAPLASFWGIATGLCVLLLAFGPGVFFLFAERIKRLRK